MFDGPFEDRLAIRERIESYGDAVFRHDAEAWIAHWSDDGVWRVAGAELRGKPQIKSAWIQAMEAYAMTAFFSTPGAICAIGAHATARVYTQELLVDHQGKLLRTVGVYEDRLVKRDGTWLFAERAYQILHSFP